MPELILELEDGPALLLETTEPFDVMVGESEEALAEIRYLRGERGEQGVQGPEGGAGPMFAPTADTRYTNFVGSGLVETAISESRVALPLTPTTLRTVERGLASWWNSTTSRISPEASGDAFAVRLTLLARPASPALLPVLIAEINNATDVEPVRIIASERQSLTGGAFEEISFNFEFFAGANFFANGGKLTLRSVAGDCVVKDPRLLIKEG
jgi:hypothetical protein